MLVLMTMSLAACSGNGSGSAPSTTQPPHPKLSDFVPSNAVVSSVKAVQMTPSGPPQQAVTYTSQDQSSTSGFTYQDLLILSWDHYARRWVDVFDGSKVQAPGATGGPAQENTVLPQDANIVRLEDFPLESSPGRVDLVFWSFLNGGANGNLEVGIVHFDGQTASIPYFDTYTPSPAGSGPSATGIAPHEQLSIPAGWLTADDPQCCAIRGFVNTVGFRTQTLSGGYKSSTYVITSSTQSWLGAYVALPPNTSGGSTVPNPVVITVVPGSPAAGVLQPGDQLISVAGVTVPTSSDLGPPVIDQIAKGLPGTTIALTILRGGSERVLNITLASTASPAYSAASAPEPGYLGVQVATEGAQNGSPAGALVESVESNSPAETAGLVAGDILTSIGSTPVTTDQGLAEALYEISPGTGVQVAYVDETGAAHAVTVTIGAYPTDNPGPTVTSV